MTTLELILTSTTTLLTGTNVIQLIVSRRKRAIESTAAADQMWRDRIVFLEERIEKLEDAACFKKNCPNRE